MKTQGHDIIKGCKPIIIDQHFPFTDTGSKLANISVVTLFSHLQHNVNYTEHGEAHTTQTVNIFVIDLNTCILDLVLCVCTKRSDSSMVKNLTRSFRIFQDIPRSA